MSSEKHVADVAKYYEFIYRWTQLTNRFGAFATAAAYPIHRGLIDPATGEFSTDTIHRRIALCCPTDGTLRALDAGCGYGGSCIALHKMLGGVWHGITISKRQVRVATANINALGVNRDVSVRLSSFDAPQPSGYTTVIGIESLIHSSAPAATIRNLVASLVPGGRLIVVDDMPVNIVPPGLADDVQRFKAMWRCPVMPTSAEWIKHIENAGCTIEAVEDLTPLMRPRPEEELVSALAEVDAKRHWRDRLGLKPVSDAQAGGLHLERLTREGGVQHVMIVARKLATA